MNTESMIQELRSVAYKNRDKIIHTGQLNISAMCESIIPKLEKLAEYESIGTPDECRAAVEKQRAKKPRVKHSEHRNFYKILTTDNYYCQSCNALLVSKYEDCGYNGEKTEYCPDCGNRVDWGDDK